MNKIEQMVNEYDSYIKECREAIRELENAQSEMASRILELKLNVWLMNGEKERMLRKVR